MQFLAPAFFAGLAALAVPVLIHLINRERRTVVEFPSLMFLQKIPYRSVRRQRLRHLLLLALRCLALALLVAAFTRPFFEPRAAAGSTPRGARERIVLLDRSYSMGYGEQWKRAIAAARAAVADLASEDRATLVLFDIDATAVTEPTSDRAVLERAIVRAAPGAEGTRYGPALRLASQVLAGSNLPRKEVVLISDFQRVGWTRRDDVRLPAGTTVTGIDLALSAAPDAAVTQVTTERTRDGERDLVTAAARITSTAREPRQVEATLELAGRAVQSKRVTVPASGSVQVRFARAPVPLEASRGSVRITRDALPADDVFHFVLGPNDAASVLVAEPPLARPNQSLYLSRALAIGDRPVFRVEVVGAEGLATADFSALSLVVLNEVPPPRGAVGARLRAAVAEGTGLLVVPGDLRDDRWSAEWGPVMPAGPGGVVDRAGPAGGSIATVDYSSPVFESFSAPRNGDFSAVRVFRQRALAVRGDSGVLARFDDGAAALVERALGRGKVLLWGTSLDEHWTDLPLQPVFLPFVRELARYAGRYSDARPWFTAGEVLDLSRHGELTTRFRERSVPTATERPELVLESPSGQLVRLSATLEPHLAALKEQGFYELRGSTTAAGSGHPIAVNVDQSEADFSHFDPRDLVAAATSGGTDGGAETTAMPEDVERRQAIWWYLLGLAAVALVVETVLSNRLSGVSA